MADNDQSKVRYDDFVSKVQADPASPQSTIMLAGYAGAGPEGHVRIYPDPTLGNWYDVPQGDVVHSMPIEDSKLGGSYVWIKSSAEIKPGSAAAPAPGPAPAAMPQPIHPTPTAVTLCVDCGGQTPATLCQPTAQTHCFICPPQSLHCPSSPIVCDTRPTLPAVCTHIGCPPPVTPHCTIGPPCPGPTPATLCCTHPPQCPPPTPLCPSANPIHCPPQTPFCPSVNPLHCPPPPPTPLCPSANPIHCPPPPTPLCPSVHPIHCPPPPTPFCPSHLVMCTHPIICQQVISGPVCPPPVTTPQLTTPQLTPQFGQGGVQQAAPQAFAAPAPAPQAALHQPLSQVQICPTPSAVQQCGQPQPTPGIICTQVFICGQSVVQTQCACPSVQVICPTPTAQVTHQIFCQQTFNLACLQTANIACLQTANIACLQTVDAACLTGTFGPQTFTPVQNGVFTPFGR